jgi:NADH-quinone oxidoreductase subunit M
VYMLWMYQRVVFGTTANPENRRLRDLSPLEWAVVLPVVALIFWIGVYPVPFTAKTEATVDALLQQVETKAGAVRLGAR